MSRSTINFIIITILVILLGAGAYFYFFVWNAPITGPDTSGTTATNGGTGFSPFDRNQGSTNTQNNGGANTGTNGATSTAVGTSTAPKVPILRQLTTTPVGGMGATSTASSTLVRFIDRGTGHISQASSKDETVLALSNTTLSRVYESIWNKNATALVLRYLKADSDDIATFYGELRAIKVATSTSEIATTPYELQGKYLSANILEIAGSPSRDKIFELVKENGNGVGYVSTFNGSKRVQIFDTPITQFNVEWPTENIITLTSKGTSYGSGVLYFFDIKSASLKKILGGLRGLSTLTSKDAGKILYSRSEGKSVSTSVYTIKDGSTQAMLFRTLADKCVWSTLHKQDLYCAVPGEMAIADYPDAWYQGGVSFVDQIWHVDTDTGEIHLIANLLKEGDRLIDATNLTFDPKENFLYFINKRDLTLWSLDLTK